MKGFIAKALLGAGLLAGANGCSWWGIEGYDDLVDPCYPQRYEYAARQEVIGAVSPQMSNGHVLDQTVWNSHFEAGGDKLTPGGMAKLGQLARRRPAPDPVVYIETAQDVPYDPANPDKLSQARKELDQKRADAVQKYLQAYAGARGMSFQVLVHDPNEVGISAIPAMQSIQRSNAAAVGTLPVGGASVGGGAGASAGGGGGAGATGGTGR
ncbi:MAG TPA: hypothetical protein VKE94_01435 [Gemmataceae bacterium]|nr:hypothetical protein [Gemmataceae bacterium]